MNGITFASYSCNWILLHIFVIGDNLDNSVPDVVGHEITSEGNELQDNIDVPLVVGGKLLSKISQLDYLQKELALIF